MISLSQEFYGVTLVDIARLMRAIAAAGDNDWVRETGPKVAVHRHRLTAEIGNMRLHLVEQGSILSLRGDGWMVNLTLTMASYRGDVVMLPSTSGRVFGSGKALVYGATVTNIEFKSANAFRHDMSILLLFESQWEN